MFFKLVATFCLMGVLPSTVNGKAVGKMNKTSAMDYLQKFGYAAQGRSSGNDFSAMIARFQKYFHLKVTGELNTETREEMSKPRCGNAEKLESDGTRAQAFRTGSRWRRTSLTYRFLSNSGDMSEATMKATFTRAFKFWSDVTPLTFREVLSGRSDFTILFARGSHGDGADFDGRGRVLAHAFFPENGRVHFDEDERYTINNSPRNGIDLLAVAVHEIGHALGLFHSDVRGSIMWPSYNGYDANLALDNDDIQGIQSLYGKGTDGGTGTGGGLSCSDNNDNCPRWSRFCRVRRYERYMSRNCQKTCNTCNAETCVDKNTNCQNWESRGFCQGIYQNYMSQNCAKSCGLC